ncbi:MAG: hypothetical protein QOJ03_26, partial [Frankiaceae bacterium]|nr:hypothetical protein [Frankiaceae bacterium]
MGGVQQLLTLPSAPESARTARRFVGEVLAAAGAEEFLDTALLLTSELVTNGIVHAHTELRLTVEATPRWVRVEVVDGNSRLPTRRDYAEDASTGRGLEMVELLADDFCVEPLVGEGKRVWFRLGAAPGMPAPDLDPTASATTDSARVTVTVCLNRMPVTLYCAWQQHADALLREATLAAFDENDPDATSEFPLAGRAFGALADAAASLFEMYDNDIPQADVEIEIDSGAAALFPILRRVLARATAMSAAGELLVPPSLPEIVALRHWVCDEVARQSAGLRPTPWVELDTDDATPMQVPAETLDDVRRAPAALVAADASNRIVAVSAAAAELLGWVAADRGGRR